jgi:hypothetical protein
MSAVDSSTRKPVDTTSIVPAPTERRLGMIFGLSEPSTRSASIRSEMPSNRGIENPQMSASRTPTVYPWAAIAVARLTVTELLPTPPLPLAIASTWQLGGIWVSGAFERAFQRAFDMTCDRSSAFISPQSMRTSDTPGWRPDAIGDLPLDVGAERASADRQLDADGDDAVVGHVHAGHHAERHDVGAELGIDDGAEHGEDVVGGGRGRRCHDSHFNGQYRVISSRGRRSLTTPFTTRPVQDVG